MITTFYAGVLGLIFLALTYYVIEGRFRFKIGLGSGGNAEMLQRMRMQGNFAEMVPITLLLMLLVELDVASKIIIHGMGITLVTGRLIHAYGLFSSSGTTVQRVLGAVLNHIVILTAAVLCILSYLL